MTIQFQSTPFPGETEIHDRRHRLSIYGHRIQIDCGACPHTGEVPINNLAHVLEIDLARPKANQTFFECPVCTTKTELVLDRFEPRRPHGWY